MNILEVIEKKRFNQPLTKDEISYAFNGYLHNEVEDYQMSALLMAICINGMNEEETINLTDTMLNSGKTLDTSKIDGIMVDKHSTGGIGDKTTLVLGPIIASLGLKIGKMSGRGLGITGGTIDKLESIPGFRVSLTEEEFIYDLNKVGFVISEQTPDMTPLDKVIYALRDVSGTTSSIPLIASSIMSKKLALGASIILIDIKVGEGALIKTKEDAYRLAEMMIEIGKHYNKKVIPVLSEMNTPLGDAIGNALEVEEAIDTLKGKTNEFSELCINLASILYSESTKTEKNEARKKVVEVINNGSAYKKFIEFVENQGGDITKLSHDSNIIPIESDKEGTITKISAKSIGLLAKDLGAGRTKKTDRIDYGVGIVLNKRIGDTVNKGDILCYLYGKDTDEFRNRAKESFMIVK